VLVISAASCGGETSVTTTQSTIGVTTSSSSPISTTAVTTTSPADLARCEGEITEIQLGVAVDGAVTGHSQPPPERLYFCVEVPSGTIGVAIELSGATADLNLFVGYPDLVTLQEGGLGFWVGEEAGIDGKQVVITPVGEGFVNPGPYYIEVSPDDFEQSSPFTLLVSASY
jgi:hypothetical protein